MVDVGFHSAPEPDQSGGQSPAVTRVALLALQLTAVLPALLRCPGRGCP